MAALDVAARVFPNPSRTDRPGNRRLSSKQIVMTTIEYAQTSHARRPTILEMCSAAAVSKRRLMYAFKEVTGVSPRRYLTLAALNHLHFHVLHASPHKNTVGDLAFSHGFYHLGRFARDYRRIYGELPSQTLRRDPP